MSTAAPEAPPAPFEFFEVRVLRTRRTSPSMVRVTFGGDRLHRFASGGRDQRLKLFLPQPGHERPVVPLDAGAEWFARWRELDPAVRGIMRTYTVRSLRRAPDEVDIDFALHGTHADGGERGGPASRWAASAAPGDRAAFLGPVVADNAAIEFRLPEGADWVLISGDETALPAVAGILEWLPTGLPALVWLEVGHSDDIQRLRTAADADVRWLVRGDSHTGTGGGERAEPAVEAVSAAEFPPGTPYAWIAGEAGAVRALRRHLVGERGIDRRAVSFTGYWRRGASEEQLLEESVSGAAGGEER